MSEEYYAINIKNKTFYDLGKGSWYALTDMEAFQDKEYLCNEILTECYYIDDLQYWSDEIKRNEIIDHICNRVCPEIFQMMIDTSPDKIRIINDCIDDITICRSKGYRCVGTRYYDVGSTQYLDRIKFKNRHLEDTSKNKILYNQDNFKIYPAFSIY